MPFLVNILLFYKYARYFSCNWWSWSCKLGCINNAWKWRGCQHVCGVAEGVLIHPDVPVVCTLFLLKCMVQFLVMGYMILLPCYHPSSWKKETSWTDHSFLIQAWETSGTLAVWEIYLPVNKVKSSNNKYRLEPSVKFWEYFHLTP